MLPVEVGVRVHHLRLEPEPEVHAQLADVLHDRVQAVGPDRRIDPPVAQPGGVVSTSVEPAVVEDETLHSDPSRTVGDAAQPVEVVVEPHRLPDVEHDRGSRGVCGQRPLVGVPDGGQPVEAVVGGGEEHPRRPVALALTEDHLTRLQELPTAEGRSAGGVTLDAEHRVAAPRDVHGEHPPPGRGEVRGAEDGHRGGAKARTALPALAQPEPVGHHVSLRRPLTLVPAGEVEHLGEVVARGQHHLEPLEEVVPGSGVGEGMAGPQRPARHGLELGEELQAGPGVRGADAQRRVRRRDVARREPRRPRASRGQVAVVAGDAVTAQVGPGEPLVTVLAEQGHPRAVAHREHATRVGETVREQTGPHHPGQCVSGRVELDAGLGEAGGSRGKEHAEASCVLVDGCVGHRSTARAGQPRPSRPHCQVTGVSP